ncbi:hypothetical protein RLOC_00013431 [Lonchura striata]|uniref:Uncharacterized protein n=1 Tax=Lonchura striata TaxID=40157 RepID=A0A218VB84_9PASE|nr:hypothetical protein RLOC_00013431 [Lonchura striata domestica]
MQKLNRLFPVGVRMQGQRRTNCLCSKCEWRPGLKRRRNIPCWLGMAVQKNCCKVDRIRAFSSSSLALCADLA